MRPTECNSADIGEDVVDDDKSSRQEEPYQTFKDVVHDEVCLYYDQVKSHVSPCELGELKSVMSLLQGCNEEDEAYELSQLVMIARADSLKGTYRMCTA